MVTQTRLALDALSCAAPAPAWLRRVETRSAVLYLADSRDVLPVLVRDTGLRPNLLCSDGPYKLTSGGRNQSQMGGSFASADGFSQAGELMPTVPWAEWIPLVYPVLADDADAYFLSNGRETAPLRAVAEGVGFKFHTLCIWDKVRATPNRWFMQHVEFATYMFKGRARPINDKGLKQGWSDNTAKETGHPTEKPIELMARYIGASTDPGDIVLDPFMGSGATGVAAVRERRRFVGIEKEETWFEIALERVRAAEEASP